MRNSGLRKACLLAILFAGGSAGATVDPDPDGIGLYFDESATTACAVAGVAHPFPAYLVITNPTAEEIWGIEFSMCTETAGGSPSQLFKVVTWYAGFLDLGIVYDWCVDGRAIQFYEPVPRVGDHVVLAMIQYMILTDMTVSFFLGPHPAESIPDGLPAYLDGNGAVLPLQLSSGNPDLPVAQVNGDCAVVATETTTFGRLKATYR
jgi:hypothetical protein